MSADKYPSTFSRQMEVIVYLGCSGWKSFTKWRRLIIIIIIIIDLYSARTIQTYSKALYIKLK